MPFPSRLLFEADGSQALRWFEEIGRTYYKRVGKYSEGERAKAVFLRMSANFGLWVKACQEFQADLRDRRYLIH